MSKIRSNVIITGRVQGVYFRVWTAEKAKALGLEGWVRNLPDGSVEAVFDGEEQVVNTMLDEVWGGPPYSEVKDVAVSAVERSEELVGFGIR
ncbi:acylphosphatase [Oligoflexia bacterium]|nr:acylphosphatase [Oligoflexia bacterium]